MSSDDKKNPTSTLQAGIDAVTGTVQSAIGSLTGSTADKAQGENKKDVAQAENDASHSTARIGGLTATPEGTIKKDDPDRSTGQWNQTVGSGKEAIGGIFGSENIKASGREQHEEGKNQQAEGEVKDFGRGVSGRLTGAIGSAAAGVTGNSEAQAAYDQQHAEGKTQQRGVEASIDKQASAAENRK